MKNRMLKRKKLNKISTFLRNKGFASKGQTDFRADRRKTSIIPNSVKIGKGKHVHRTRSFKQMKKAS